MLLSLLLHATLLTWYVLYQRDPVTEAYAPVMSLRLVAAISRKSPRPPPRRQHQSPPVPVWHHIVQTPMAATPDDAPVVAPAVSAASPADLMAEPFANGPKRPSLGPEPTRPCEALDRRPRPCAPAGPLPRFDLDWEREGREFAFQGARRRAMRRYRNGEAYPGLNCAIFQSTAFHLCKTNGVDP